MYKRQSTGSRPRQGDEHPAYALLVEYGPFTFTIPTGTPRAHHKAIFDLFPGVRMQTGTKCFQLTTKSSGRPQQLQLCRQRVPCSRCADRERLFSGGHLAMITIAVASGFIAGSQGRLNQWAHWKKPGLPSRRTHRLEQPTGQRDICPVSVKLPSAFKNISVPRLVP